MKEVKSYWVRIADRFAGTRDVSHDTLEDAVATAKRYGLRAWLDTERRAGEDGCHFRGAIREEITLVGSDTVN